MQVYAGIDEAGYGPMFGPLVVGRSAFRLSNTTANTPVPDLWQRLSKAVCRNLKETRRGRIAVNDSKKLHSSGRGVRHLEIGTLAFAGAHGLRPSTVDQWLDGLGERSHHDLTDLPWYQVTIDRPWATLPSAVTDGEIAVARGMLGAAAKAAGVEVADVGAAVVFENRFNKMVAATRSKAATNFTFVTGHLEKLWRRFGTEGLTVAVDRQSGRTHYRELLSMSFPDAALTVLAESPSRSGYHLETQGPPRRAMTVWFEVDAETHHLPVALASMISKYTRELMMARFQSWFADRAPSVRPTAGYALDAKRFWRQIQPTLTELAIRPHQLRRIS